MTAKEENFIYCKLASEILVPIKGSRIFKCSKCDQDVWVSKASLMAVGADAILICGKCFLNTISDESMVYEVKKLTPAQIKELEN